MADTNNTRLRSSYEFPKVVYLETLAFFFAANFMFHQNVFRKSGSRFQYAAFSAVNLFTSFQLADCMNKASMRRYAVIYNNTIEMQHRNNLTYKLRQSLFQQKQIWAAVYFI